VLFNALIDWVTIAQTQTFFSISAAQGRVGRALLIIVADFIVTTNIFILLYAGLIATLIFQVWDAPRQPVRVKANVSVHSIPPNAKRLTDYKPFGAAEGQDFHEAFFFYELPTEQGESPKGAVRVFSASKEIGLVDVIGAASALTRFEVTEVARYKEVEETEAVPEGDTQKKVEEDAASAVEAGEVKSEQPRTFERRKRRIDFDEELKAWSDLPGNLLAEEYQEATLRVCHGLCQSILTQLMAWLSRPSTSLRMLSPKASFGRYPFCRWTGSRRIIYASLSPRARSSHARTHRTMNGRLPSSPLLPPAPAARLSVSKVAVW
jgi:hypothetical protein